MKYRITEKLRNSEGAYHEEIFATTGVTTRVSRAAGNGEVQRPAAAGTKSSRKRASGRALRRYSRNNRGILITGIIEIDAIGYGHRLRYVAEVPRPFATNNGEKVENTRERSKENCAKRRGKTRTRKEEKIKEIPACPQVSE